MRRIVIDRKAFWASPRKKKFIVLGSEKSSSFWYIKRKILPKIVKKTTQPVPGFWGTLGFSNDEKINWSGYIETSSEGNDDFTGAVKEEVELIKEFYPTLTQDPSSICERFIAFEHLDFTFPEVFSLLDIPSLRLDLMLQPDEGAVVFYQSDGEDVENATIEYIQPQATEGFFTDRRDRLSYLFDIVPQYQLEELEGQPGLFRLSSAHTKKPFIIKIITFRRNTTAETGSGMKAVEGTDSKTILKQLEGELIKKKQPKQFITVPCLLVYDRGENNFKPAKSGQISIHKKTLFLMHGTFASTEASFGDLYGEKGTWLLSLTDPSRGNYYEQIIAFDHPTVFYGAKENIDALFMKLDELGIGVFSEEVDFIGTSQGGLLIQYLANQKPERIKVGKAALVASANGVGYFTAAKYVSKFLSILKYIYKRSGMQAQYFVAALAQHSAEFLLDQPGFQIMTPGNDKLNAIINTPPYREETVYLPVIDDYNKSLLDTDQDIIIGDIKKMGAGLIDKIAKLILGEENDWVVGSRNQFIIPARNCVIPDYNPAKFRNDMISAIHGTCIQKAEAQKAIYSFLFETRPSTSLPAPSKDFFDAHCHIFGREIINGRILNMLLQDLLSYRKAKKERGKPTSLPTPTDNTVDHAKDRGLIAKNIIEYFLFNKDSYQMLNDLQDEYYKLKSNVYKYVPLMFDLEMSFRNRYYEDDTEKNIIKTGKKLKRQLKKQIKNLLRDINAQIKKTRKRNAALQNGPNHESDDKTIPLKLLKTSLRLLGDNDIDLTKGTVSGFQKQLEELEGLKVRYGDNISPFLAVDPRRDKISEKIEKYVGTGKIFRGIKLYTPNGYSPTDPHLFDDSPGFIQGKSLYSYCSSNNIPIIAHCSSVGFGTFAMDLDVWGDIYKNNVLVHYDCPTKITFCYNMVDGGFEMAVKERATLLNHPEIWRKVLEKYPGLKICLAHFGRESEYWEDEIAQLMRTYHNVYTDLSCMIDKNSLKAVKERYFDTGDPITNRMMYGSDYFFNLLHKIRFNDYYTHFTSQGIFSRPQMQAMSCDIPGRFLG